MINPKDYPENTPEWVLAKFLEAWEKRSYGMMICYCQLSWLGITQFSPSIQKKILFAQFRYKLLDAKILKTEKISDATRDISVEIYYKDINIKKRIKRKARLICEKAPMQPSPEGTWGINPTSMIRARK